jgi:hypothetical protein
MERSDETARPRWNQWCFSLNRPVRAMVRAMCSTAWLSMGMPVVQCCFGLETHWDFFRVLLGFRIRDSFYSLPLEPKTRAQC